MPTNTAGFLQQSHFRPGECNVMIIRILTLSLLLLGLTTFASAATLHGTCTIHFLGKSTLHNFDGQVACQPFSLVVEENESGAQIIRQPLVEIPVREMDTDNDRRDEKMYAMFESRGYPLIRSRFADLDLTALLERLQAGGSDPARLDFTLQIRDRSLPVQAAIRNLKTAPEQITFDLEFPLSLASFRLEPPSVLGLIRVDDLVRVEASVQLRRD
jgi:hypothetical protein